MTNVASNDSPSHICRYSRWYIFYFVPHKPRNTMRVGQATPSSNSFPVYLSQNRFICLKNNYFFWKVIFFSNFFHCISSSYSWKVGQSSAPSNSLQLPSNFARSVTAVAAEDLSWISELSVVGGGGEQRGNIGKPAAQRNQTVYLLQLISRLDYFCIVLWISIFFHISTPIAEICGIFGPNPNCVIIQTCFSHLCSCIDSLASCSE